MARENSCRAFAAMMEWITLFTPTAKKSVEK